MAKPPSPNKAMYRPPSPHTYENLENLMIDAADGFNGVNGAKGGKGQRPKSVSDLQGVKTTPSPPRPKSEYSPTRPRPMTKYQHQLAEGIYANMNRPDLQSQKVRPADIVQNSPKRGPVDSLVGQGAGREGSPSDSASSSSIDSQIGGIVRKIHAPNGSASKERSPQPTDTNGRKDLRKGKVPPPPPVRKTSTLSSGDETPKSEQPKEPKAQNGGPKPRLSNGDIPQKSVKSVTIAPDTKDPQSTIRRVNKKFEETEIY